ncbi:MAG TPA: SPOR domain-containing protein [Usitatibacter sp.]|nr:SPOR domain-containing protein [Usitatibacter sp.]
MASSASTEASEIRRRGRQRLIGAIAIVLVLVVFVPMVLDSEPRAPRHEPALEIPAKENAAPLPAPAQPSARALTPPSPARVGAPASETPAKGAKNVAPASETPAKAAPATKNVAPASAPKLEGFAVQVGAFRDEAKLRQARDKLTQAGIAHYIERLESNSGALTRLRAGPFATREAGESALASIRGAGLEAQLVPLP